LFELQAAVLPESRQPKVLLGRCREAMTGKMQAKRYSRTHKRIRAQLMPLVRSGRAKCARCGLPIEPHEDWHLDHADNGNGYNGPAHVYCNTAAPGWARGASEPPPDLVWDEDGYAEDPGGFLWKFNEEGRPSRVSRRW
jgi:hypothetical protein